MTPDYALRPQADRLARLLADARGAEILAELQRLSVMLHTTASPPEPGEAADGPADVGIWRAERLPEGTALRRREVEGVDLWHWADADYVPPPPAGARRLVLIGESVARGWAYEPAINPAMALARQLEGAAPGAYQCVDLAQSGATAEDLAKIVGQLHRIEPDIVVVMAGNNWGCLPEDPAISLSDLVEIVRAEDYPALRRRFISQVIVPRAEAVVRSLRNLHREHGTEIVVVLPEFNLRGWAPPKDIDLPVLPDARFAGWHKLSEGAELACREGRWADVIAAAREMTELDGGTSPVPGQLIGQAAAALGNGALAREGLESSRDALTGLGIAGTPRILREARDALISFADQEGLPCVDMGTALAAADLPELPDPRFYFDYCHLTDQGIELVMSRVADTVLGQPAGTARPGPGVEPWLQAALQLISAAHGAFHGQPAEAVTAHLQLAIDAFPDATMAMTWLLDVLEGAGPVWARPAVEHLAGLGPGAALFGPVLHSRSMPPELWTLRACLGQVLERLPAEAPPVVDLLAAPFQDGHKPPNLAPGRAFYQATGQRSAFAFAVTQPVAGQLTICYRTPGPPGAAAGVMVNDRQVGTLAPAASWVTATVPIPAQVLQPGVNWLHVRWPVPVIDAARKQADDAAAMTRGEFPYVLPVFGELFDASLALG
jgi:hypothetical protein